MPRKSLIAQPATVLTAVNCREGAKAPASVEGRNSNRVSRKQKRSLSRAPRRVGLPQHQITLNIKTSHVNCCCSELRQCSYVIRLRSKQIEGSVALSSDRSTASRSLRKAGNFGVTSWKGLDMEDAKPGNMCFKTAPSSLIPC